MATCKSVKTMDVETAPRNVGDGHVHIHTIALSKGGTPAGLSFDDNSLVAADGREMTQIEHAIDSGEPVYIWWNFLRPTKSRKRT